MAHFSEFTPALNVVIQKPAPACDPGMSLILNHAEAGRWPCEILPSRCTETLHPFAAWR
jgi:hypothetical protein